MIASTFAQQLSLNETQSFTTPSLTLVAVLVNLNDNDSLWPAMRKGTIWGSLIVVWNKIMTMSNFLSTNVQCHVVVSIFVSVYSHKHRLRYITRYIQHATHYCNKQKVPNGPLSHSWSHMQYTSNIFQIHNNIMWSQKPPVSGIVKFNIILGGGAYPQIP